MTLNGTETTIGTFSRATTLTGAWSSGTLTVTASPQGQTYSCVLRNGSAYRSGDYLYVPVLSRRSGTDTNTGFNAYANWKNLLTSRSRSVYGVNRYDSGNKTTLYYKSGDDYHAAGNYYWYYKSTDTELTTLYN